MRVGSVLAAAERLDEGNRRVLSIELGLDQCSARSESGRLGGDDVRVDDEAGTIWLRIVASERSAACDAARSSASCEAGADRFDGQISGDGAGGADGASPSESEADARQHLMLIAEVAGGREPILRFCIDVRSDPQLCAGAKAEAPGRVRRRRD